MDAAVIGCGKFGYFHAEKYAAMDNVSLEWVVDADRNRAKEVAEKFDCQFADDYRTIGQVALVSVVTPNVTHYEVARYFISQGSDVLIEKPMTTSSAELEDLTERAKFKGIRLWGGFLERYNSIFRGVAHEKNLIEEIYTHRSCAYRECRIDEDVVFDLMVHDIFLVNLLIGSRIREVEVERHNSLSNCNDFVRAKVQFSNGDKADLTARRDINDKTKLFGVKCKGLPWKLYNLKDKINDTLKEELMDFASGNYFHLEDALKSMKMAEKILK